MSTSRGSRQRRLWQGLKAVLLALLAMLLLSSCGSDQQGGSPAPPQQEAEAEAEVQPLNAPPTQQATLDPNAVQENSLSQGSTPEGDPFLRYAQNVQLSIGQVDLADFPTVRAFVTAKDENGILIRTLKEADFKVLENDVLAGNVRFANREALNLPLAIQFVVDISGSMEGSMELEVEAIKSFVSQLSPRDRVGLVTFSDAAIRNVPLTTDHQQLLDRLDRLTPWGQTTLWDGIMLGMEELLADDQPARRALVVLSDGLDNKSIDSPSSIMQWHDDNAVANNMGFSVFALGLGMEVDRGPLGQIATKTGGVYLDSPSASDLEQVYQTILNQIQSEYILEYDAPVESEPTEIIDLDIGLNNVQSFVSGTYTYRSPGLSSALARLIWPGLAVIGVLLTILVIATIFKITRRVWMTVMITPLEGRDYSLPTSGADIGSLESCELRVGGDAAILPIHARVRETADGYLLEAVDPLSPIFIGPKMLSRKLLRGGDRFRLGRTDFIFNERIVRPGDGREELADQAAPPSASPIAPLTEEAQLATSARSAEPVTGERRRPERMVGISGPYSGQSFELAQGENLIGRSEGSIVLGLDSQVSRRHATVTLSGAVASLRDESSTNGTRLNGRASQPGMSQSVYAGDRLGLGDSEFRLE